MSRVRGALRVLNLYDVAEEIRLDHLRAILHAEAPRREPSFKHPAPEYVRFETAPVTELVKDVLLPGGEVLDGTVKYYEYGVVSVELELPFETDWDGLVSLAARLIPSPDIDQRAAEIARRHLKQIATSWVKPYPEWLSEDYYIVQLQRVEGADGRPLTGAELLDGYGDRVAQIVRGEALPLSAEETKEILRASISYYPTDMLVVGWTAAVVYDTPEGAQPTIQLLDYANTQLLEFRHYDGVLTSVLRDVYASIERRSRLWSRWTMARQAERLNTLRLDVMELTERTDNAIKFLSDMFYARLYRLAAARVGVPDYRKLVDDKLGTAGELYQSLVSEFHAGRAFILELMVVIILIIDLFFLFRGKT